jgi:hypothetical protein
VSIDEDVSPYDKNVRTDPGALFYMSLDGTQHVWPGNPAWEPTSLRPWLGELDLCNMRLQLIHALTKVEDALAERKLLDRVTQ